jgi:hypothetical protein
MGFKELLLASQAFPTPQLKAYQYTQLKNNNKSNYVKLFKHAASLQLYIITTDEPGMCPGETRGEKRHHCVEMLCWQ